MKVVKGDAAVVVSGRKVAIGTTGKVIWAGETKYGVRVGLKDAAGTVHWTAMGNVEKADAVAPVVAPVVDEPTPGVSPTLEKKVEALLALTNLLAAGMMALETKVAALEAAAAAPAPAPFIPDGVDPFDVAAFTH